MTVSLITHPQLQRQRFPRVRRRLSAGWTPRATLKVGYRPQVGSLPVAQPSPVLTAQLAHSSSEAVKPATARPQPVVPAVNLFPSKSTSTKLRKPGHTIFQGLLTLIIVASLVVGGVLAVPHLYYTFFPKETVPVITQEVGTPLGGEFQEGTETTPKQYEPPQDASLPEGKWLIIPRIGVRTELQETADSEEALAKGVWLVPEYGQPGDRSKPMIAAAHRYGWKWWWESDYWKYHSFNLLPEVQPGDTVEVIADQRKWVYEIYAGAEGDEITDYDADLILYTCKFLNSPVRHFRYARLIDPTQNTQVSAL